MVKKKIISFFSWFINNPLVTAAILSAVFFYSGILRPASRNGFSSLCESSEICCLEGTISSSPVIFGKDRSLYAFDFATVKSISSSGMISQCHGTVKILLLSDMAEALYPGKLYSSSKDSPVLFETGANLKINVEPGFLENSYKLKSVEQMEWNKFYLFRALCRIQFKRLMYGWGPAGGLLLALLSGSREYTELSVSDGFRKAGISHILALSGMHLNLFGGIASFFGKRIVKKNIADFVELGAVSFFVWFAGLSPSLLRALISSIIITFNSTLRMKRFKGLTVLSCAFLLHIMIFPTHMESAAFKLSYGALAGILTAGEEFKKIISFRFIPALKNSLASSCGAQLFTAPVTVLMFGKLMPAGIISSVFVSPVVIIFLYTGLAGTFLCLLMPFLNGLFNGIMNCLYGLLKTMVMIFALIPPIPFTKN